MSKDIGNKCVECLQDTSFGSGKFVNRIPSDNGMYDGYECSDCQSCEIESEVRTKFFSKDAWIYVLFILAISYFPIRSIVFWVFNV